MIASRTDSCWPGCVGKVEHDIQGDRKHPSLWRYNRAVREDIAMIWRSRLPGSTTFLLLFDVALCCPIHIIPFFPLCFYCIILWGNTALKRMMLGSSQLACDFEAMLIHTVSRGEERKPVAEGLSSGDPTAPSSHPATLFVQFCPALLVGELALINSTHEQ